MSETQVVTMSSGAWLGRAFLITGPTHLLDERSGETALDRAKTMLSPMKLKDWIVSVETSDDGYVHYHITIQCYKSTKQSTVRKWFPKFNTKACHPKGGDDSAWNYTMKDGNYAVKEKAQGQRTDLLEMKALIDKGASDKELWNKYFTRMTQYHRSMKTYRELMDIQVEDKDPEVDIERFVHPNIDDWSLPIVIVGKSLSGKTSYALAQFQNPCMISNIEDLREKYDPDEHDGLVFDDMKFTDGENKLSRAAQIHLLDIKWSRSIRMRNTNWVRPKGVKMIFTCNEEDWPIFATDMALTRRYNMPFGRECGDMYM